MGSAVSDGGTQRTTLHLVGDGPDEEQTRPTQSVTPDRVHARVVEGGEPKLERGTELGRYLILDLIGSGGMGLVYSAYDPELDRRIAIKVLRVKYWDDVGRGRAMREAQTLARLAHPNVVQIFDVGAMGDQLFLAMELVQGKSLRDWLDAEPRSWRQVVKVLVEAGRGLAAAHDAGLVHRDVKPRNILVPDEGGARIVDFGVARGRRAPSEGPEEELVGTPAYMAPEQRVGQATIESDVFSFCLTAWEALYGYLPEPMETSSTTAGTRSSITERKRQRAHATEAPPRHVRRALRRGLSADPERRHPDVEALLRELAPAPAARAVRRAWLVTGLLAVAAGLALWAREPAMGPQERCKLAGEAVDSWWNDDVRGDLTRSFASLGKPYAIDSGARFTAAVDRMATSWSATRREVCEATWVRGEQSEALLDARMECLDRRQADARALVTLYRGDVDQGMVQRAVSAASQLGPPADCRSAEANPNPLPDDPKVRAQLVELQDKTAEVRSLRRAGRMEEAGTLGAEIVAMAETLDYAPALAEALFEQGLGRAASGKTAEARDLYERTLLEAARAGDDVLSARALASLVWHIGYNMDRREEALATLPVARAALVRAGDPPAVREEVLSSEASLHLNSGDYAKARAGFERAYEVAKEHLPTDDPRIGKLLHNIGLVAHYEGESEVAVDYLTRGRDLWKETLGERHPQVALALNNLGLAFHALDRRDEAAAAYEQALDIWEQAHGPNHPDVGMVLVNLGQIRAGQGRLDEALAHHRRALSIREGTLGDQHQNTGIAVHNVGNTLGKLGRHEESVEYHRRSVDIFSKLPAGHGYRIVAGLALARAQARAGRFADAVASVEAVRAEVVEHKPARVGEVDFAMAEVLWMQGGPAKKRALARARDAESAHLAADKADSAADVRAWIDERVALR